MDMTCPRCGENWDNDTIHEEVEERAALGITTTYTEVAREFASKGCEYALAAFIGRWDRRSQCERVDSTRTAVASALFDLMGDDTDGVMSMMDDFDFMFGGE